MRLISKPALVVAAVALMAAAAGCSSGTSASTGTGTSGSGTTLTYWASDQGSSVSDDYTGAQPGTGQVPEADGHQGQPGGHRLGRPAEPGPRRDHVRAGTLKPRKMGAACALDRWRQSPRTRKDFAKGDGGRSPGQRTAAA